MIALGGIPSIDSSANIRVSVLTLEPGNEIYSLFGHTAIRITNYSLNADMVFNFGTFDFNNPGFCIRFIRGELLYSLSIEDYISFLESTVIENRTVHEQVLKIPEDAKIKLFERLMNCYRSPHRYYPYDFFYNNCATKVRDFVFDPATVVCSFDSLPYDHKTFRQLLVPYIRQKYWVNLGINLLLGPAADKTASAKEYLFLPYYIQNALKQTKTAMPDQVILQAGKKKETGRFPGMQPWIIVAIISALAFISATRRIIFHGFMSVVGISGLIILSVDLISTNGAYSHNCNILWTIPAIIMLIFRNTCIYKIVAGLYLLLLTSFLLFRNFLPQEISITFIPWMICLMVVLLANAGFSGMIGKRTKKPMPSHYGV